MEAALLKFFGGAGQGLETESGGNKFSWKFPSNLH